MTEFEKMCLGLEYDAFSREFGSLRKQAFTLLQKINSHQFEDGKPFVAQLLKHVGKDSVICSPFLCEYGKTISIGARSVVAAGSVVTKDVPPDTLVGGTPAKTIKELDQ